MLPMVNVPLCVILNILHINLIFTVVLVLIMYCFPSSIYKGFVFFLTFIGFSKWEICPLASGY